MKYLYLLVSLTVFFILPTRSSGQSKKFMYFMLEDDFLHYNGHGSDRYYSGGMQLGFTLLKLKNSPEIHRFFIQQKMYTPTDITQTAVQYNDYPYAGLLYLQYNYSRYGKEKNNVITVKGAIGTTGKASFAEPFQKEFHRWIGYKKPMGWSNAKELGLMVQFEAEAWHRFSTDPWGSWYGFAVIEAGSLFASARIGNHIQFGWRASSALDHILRIGSIEKSRKVSLYAFFSPQLTAVIQNRLLSAGLESNPISLDGDKGIHVSSFIFRTSTGVYLQTNTVSVRLAQHFNTREFVAARPHTYGEISILYNL